MGSIDNIAKIYNIYSPYIKNSVVSNKNLRHDKYKDLNIYYNNGNNINSQGNKVIPNRKLSPLGSNKQMIKI